MSSPLAASTSMVANLPRSNVQSAEPSSPMSSWSRLESVALTRSANRSADGLPETRSAPSITLALTVGAGRRDGHGDGCCHRAASASAAASTVFRFIPKISCPPPLRVTASVRRIGDETCHRPYADGADRSHRVRRRFRARSLREFEPAQELAQDRPRASRPLPDRALQELAVADREFAATAASTTSRPSRSARSSTPRRSLGSASRRTSPRRSSRSMRLVTPADDSISPGAETGRGEAIAAAPRSAGRSAPRPRRGPGRSGRRPLPAAWRGAAPMRLRRAGHLERAHVEVGAGLVPARRAVGRSGLRAHARHCSDYMSN